MLFRSRQTTNVVQALAGQVAGLQMTSGSGQPGGENLSMQTNAGKTVKVTYRLEVPAGFLGQKWKLEVSGKAKPLRPVGWIRKVKGTVDMLGEVTP